MSPFVIGIGPDERLYFSGTGNRIAVWEKDGTYVREFKGAHPGSIARSIRISDNGDIYVAVYDVIEQEEPWLKEQMNTVIYAGYDFMLGETDALNIVIPLEEKKRELREPLWDAFVAHTNDWLPTLVKSGLAEYLSRNIDVIVDDIPPENLPEEIAGASEEQVQLYLVNYLQDVSDMIDQGYVPDISGLLESTVKPYFDEQYDKYIMSELPSELVIDRNEIGDDAWDQIMMARRWVGLFQTLYWVLIAVMILLAACIFAINRNVKESTRSLGISLAVYGALEFAGVYVARHFLTKSFDYVPMDDFNVPQSLQDWLSGFTADLLAPLQLFSIIIFVVGAALIVTSILYRRRTGEHDVVMDDSND